MATAIALNSALFVPNGTTDSASPTVVFESFELPATNQRNLGAPHPGGTLTPLALRPSGQGDDIDLETVIQTVKSLQARGGILTEKLAVHGTLLFRGLPIHNAEDFSRFAHAFGYKPHEIIGIVVNRPLLAPNVAPANEAPKERWRNPISSSLELFNRAKDEIPEFIAEITEKGILSRVTYKFDRQYEGGSTLKQAFGKEFQEGDDDSTKKAKIEAQISRYGRGEHTTWEWIEDGVVLTHRLPAVRTQPGTNLPTLFTGLAAYWQNAQGGNGSRKEVTKQLYGDGTPIPERYLEHLSKITDEIRVLHKWQQGDILVYDNIIAQHGRQPWEGEQSDRVVLASLFDGNSVPGAYNDKSWGQVVQALE
ncbi:taurine catabolism dioxygenase [Colletotrichum kahawae]|uniref:Taurine catabolism dioxygenase n=1 Tax=Colletotrichum kahawae TaxID=34407 RepID=A0AAD9YDR7_COLKA|nr:taurine catabolism dioxygenase [Colletotrichum kahawae]